MVCSISERIDWELFNAVLIVTWTQSLDLTNGILSIWLQPTQHDYYQKIMSTLSPLEGSIKDCTRWNSYAYTLPCFKKRQAKNTSKQNKPTDERSQLYDRVLLDS